MRPLARREHAYDSARPAYPTTVVDAVREELISASVPHLLDVGCGTGRSTRLLSTLAQRVTGIDPVPAMIEVARSVGAPPNVTYQLGSAERTRVAAGSVQVVSAASCFEWFDVAAFKAEVRRVAAPNARVVLLWSHLGTNNDPVTRAWDDLMRARLGPRIGPDRLDILAMAHWFAEGKFRTFRCVTRHDYDANGLLELARSSSSWPQARLPERTHRATAAIAAYFRDHECGGQVALSFETTVMITSISDWA